MAVAYQVEYLNLKEIFLYSNLKSFYQWPVNYLNGQLTPVDSINLNISQERYTKLKNDVEISKRLELYTEMEEDIEKLISLLGIKTTQLK